MICNSLYIHHVVRLMLLMGKLTGDATELPGDTLEEVTPELDTPSKWTPTPKYLGGTLNSA